MAITIYQFHIFVLLGEKSQKEAIWTPKQFEEAEYFINLYYPNKQLSSSTNEGKQIIVDEMKALYNKYRSNPELVGAIFKQYEADEKK